jgi:hypothetical protein
MLIQAKVKFLCDVDNTLLDNDRFAVGRQSPHAAIYQEH